MLLGLHAAAAAHLFLTRRELEVELLQVKEQHELEEELPFAVEAAAAVLPFDVQLYLARFWKESLVSYGVLRCVWLWLDQREGPGKIHLDFLREQPVRLEEIQWQVVNEKRACAQGLLGALQDSPGGKILELRGLMQWRRCSQSTALCLH